MFLEYFDSTKIIFENELALTPCSILTCDHTFKVIKHIGVVRTGDKTFVSQFQNLFIGLDEHGEVVNWRLTKTTEFEQLEDLLAEFKSDSRVPRITKLSILIVLIKYLQATYLKKSKLTLFTRFCD
jgi:hypothetical protein